MNVNLFKRILAGLLAALTLGSMAACAGGDGSTDTTAPVDTTPVETEPVETEPTTDEWGREIVKDDIPEDLRFDGETFTFLGRTGNSAELYIEEPTGDIINDSVHARNLRVEDRLGVEIELIERPGSWNDRTAYTAIITNAIMSNTEEFQAVAAYGYYAPSAALLECYYNLANLPNTNFEKPWWRQNYIEAATARNQFYTVIGDLNLTSIKRTLAMFFNKRVAEQYGVTDLYDMVLNGTWTMDKLMEITKDTATDINGNGTLDNADFYGLISDYGSVACDGWLPAFHLSTITLNNEGEPVVTMDVDITTQAISKVQQLLFNNNGVKMPEDGVPSKFMAGEAIFMIDGLDAGNSLREMEDDYGVIPLPKFDEKQEKYGTTAQDSYNAMSIMRNISKPEMVGAVFELLNAESWKTVRPEFCEETIKFRYMRDSESGQVFDILVDCVNFDYGMVYSINLNNIAHTIRNEIRDNKSTLASSFAATSKLLTKQMEKMDMMFIDRQGE